VQVLQTARHLKEAGTEVDVLLTNQKVDYKNYDLFHFFNITRPADILFHITKIKKPFALSTILVDYSEYDRIHRKGVSGMAIRLFPAGANEYIKTIARWLFKKDSLQSKDYLWKGQQKSILNILEKGAVLLPNSEAEYKQLQHLYAIEKKYAVVPNGIDVSIFQPEEAFAKDNKLVICVARIEGRKNQLNLIKALRNTSYTLLLIGARAPNQKKYYDACKKIATPNILFHGQLSQPELINYYKRAKVHVLPSWFESCGLSSMEAAAMGCNIVITDKGFTKEYFGDDAFYCNPESPESIFSAIEKAAQSEYPKKLQQNIIQNYTWQRAAAITMEAYKQITPA
jgi:glycosyltransferase involved in cell wall biosynthesis